MSDLDIVLSLSEAAVEQTLPRQVLQGHGRDLGGIQDPTTRYSDPRGSMFLCNLWTAVFLYERSRLHGQADLAGRISLLMDFMLRRQHADGTIDLGNWRHAPCEVGFTLPAACTNYRKMQSMPSLPRRAELLDKLAAYIERGGRAVREGQMYTANHRWAPGVAALAHVQEIFPHPGNLERIEDYLDDGIDCTHEGIYYAERSPNYNGVANWGLLLAAEKLNRPHLLDPVRRNLDFGLHMINPSGFAESGLSFRQDRGSPKARHGSYAIYRILSVKDGNGMWAQAADEMLVQEAASERTWGDFIPTLQIFDRPGLSDEAVPRHPLPVEYHKHYVGGQIVRFRKGSFAATLKADAKPYEQTGWGGPVGEANFLALYSGKAAIEAVMVKFGYNPDQSFKPAQVERTDGGYRLAYHWRGFPLRLDHRRPGRRDIWMAADFRVTVDVLLQDRGANLIVQAEGLDHVPVAIELLVDPAGELTLDGRAAALPAGGRVWFEAAEATYRVGDHGFAIRPGLCEHRMAIGDVQIVTGDSEKRCARLTLCGYAPFRHELEVLLL